MNREAGGKMSVMDCDRGESGTCLLPEDTLYTSALSVPDLVLSDVRDWAEQFSRASGGKVNVDLYGDRGMFRYGAKVVALAAGRNEEIESFNKEYLPRIGIAQRELYLVNDVASGDFFDAVQADEALMRRIREGVACGEKIEAFSASERFDRFVADHGATSLTAAAKIAKELNDKWDARLLARRLGPHVAATYPNFALCETRDQVRDAVRSMVPEYGAVVVKARALSAGLGMYRVTDPTDVEFEEFLEHRFDPAGMIVEEFVKVHVPVSVQWELVPEGEIRAFFAEQVMVEETDTFDGCDIGSLASDVLKLREHRYTKRLDVEGVVWDLGRAELEYARRQGYVGRIGMDALLPYQVRQQVNRRRCVLEDTIDFSRPLKLEWNARITAATYVGDLRTELARHDPRSRMPAVSMRSCRPYEHIVGWREAVEALATVPVTGGYTDLNYDPRTGEGVVVMLTRRLPEVCTVVGVHPTDITRARKLALRARGRLGHWSRAS